MVKKNIVRWILGLFLFVIITYPGSPFFYQFLVGNAQYAYLMLLLVSTALCILLKNAPISVKPKPKINTFRLLQIFVYLSMVLTLLTTQNPTALRDLVSYTVILGMIFLIRDQEFIYLLTTKYLLASILVALSMLAYIIWFAFPDIFSDWMVRDLSINGENPIIRRQMVGDFEYSMLFYYSVILHDTELNAYLLGSIFTEPTHVFAFCMGPLFFCLRTQRFKGRLFVIISLLIYMVYTLTLFPFLIMIFGLFIAVVLLIFRPSIRRFKISILFVLLGGWFLWPFFLATLLSLIPEAKSAQLDFYFGSEQLIALTSSSNLFGLSETPDWRSWGSSIIVFRYGYFGFLVWASLVIFYLIEACKFLLDRELSKSRRFFSFMALFSATLMSLKVPSMLLITSLLIYIGLGYLNRLKGASGELSN